MRIKTFARGLTLLVALAVALTVMAVPASAAEPKAIASIDAGQRTVIAGAPTSPFQITVTNVPNPAAGPTSASPSINRIRIHPPAFYYTALPTAFQVPTGWTMTVQENTFLFRTTTNAIPAGGTQAFTMATSVARPPVDVTREWVVRVSGNDGDTYINADPDPEVSRSNPTGTGRAALQTTIRVLQVVTTRLAFPPGVTDGSVTSGQTANVQLDVTNHGSGTLKVIPDVTFSVPSGSNASATLIRSAATCPDGSAAQPARQMGPQTTTSFTCQVKYDGDGAITTNGRASGTPTTGTGSATAIGSSQAGSVMTAAVFNYVNQSLQPTEVRPGGAVVFRLSLQKTGQVSVTLNKANTTLSFGPAGNPTKFTATLNEPSDVPAGGSAASPVPVFLQFTSTTVPADMPSGKDDPTSGGKAEYTPTLTVTGTDQNDFGVSSKPTIPDRIVVDALGPLINLNRPVPPPSRVIDDEPTEPDDPNNPDRDPSDDPATTNNALVTFSGSIRDRGAACGACPIVSSVIRQFDLNGAPIAGADIRVTIANNQGNLSGTYDKVYHPAAFSMALVVVGADPGGNTTTAQSALLPVDNLIPSLKAAVTGTDVQADENGEIRVNRLISVKVSEPLAAGMAASDWVVDGHRVVSAEPQPSRGNFTSVRLTVDPELDRNEEPAVTYQPTAGSRANDRVGLLLPNTTILSVDGIVPRLPEILTIAGMEKQEDDNGDERFFTNDDTPAIEIEVDPGDEVTVYEDCVTAQGNACAGGTKGELDNTDIARCTRRADPGQTVVTCTGSFGLTSRDATIFARSIDARDNVGPFLTELLTLDFIRPVISAIQRVVNDLQVTFSETLSDLRGRNHADDWRVDITDGQATAWYNPNRVDGRESRVRTLRDNGLWSQPGMTIVSVRYLVDVFQPQGRYSDRAGNEVLDQTFALAP